MLYAKLQDSAEVQQQMDAFKTLYPNMESQAYALKAHIEEIGIRISRLGEAGSTHGIGNVSLKILPVARSLMAACLIAQGLCGCTYLTKDIYSQIEGKKRSSREAQSLTPDQLQDLWVGAGVEQLILTATDFVSVLEKLHKVDASAEYSIEVLALIQEINQLVWALLRRYEDESSECARELLRREKNTLNYFANAIQHLASAKEKSANEMTSEINLKRNWSSVVRDAKRWLFRDHEITHFGKAKAPSGKKLLERTVTTTMFFDNNNEELNDLHYRGTLAPSGMRALQLKLKLATSREFFVIERPSAEDRFSLERPLETIIEDVLNREIRKCWKESKIVTLDISEECRNALLQVLGKSIEDKESASCKAQLQIVLINAGQSLPDESATPEVVTLRKACEQLQAVSNLSTLASQKFQKDYSDYRSDQWKDFEIEVSVPGVIGLPLGSALTLKLAGQFSFVDQDGGYLRSVEQFLLQECWTQMQDKAFNIKTDSASKEVGAIPEILPSPDFAIARDHGMEIKGEAYLRLTDPSDQCQRKFKDLNISLRAAKFLNTIEHQTGVNHSR